MEPMTMREFLRAVFERSADLDKTILARLEDDGVYEDLEIFGVGHSTIDGKGRRALVIELRRPDDDDVAYHADGPAEDQKS